MSEKKHITRKLQNTPFNEIPMFEPGIKKNCIVLEKVLYTNRLSPPRVTKLNSTYCDVYGFRMLYRYTPILWKCFVAALPLVDVHPTDSQVDHTFIYNFHLPHSTTRGLG